MQVERLNVSKANVVQINDSNLAAKGKKQSVIASAEATSKSNRSTQVLTTSYSENTQVLSRQLRG